MVALWSRGVYLWESLLCDHHSDHSDQTDLLMFKLLRYLALSPPSASHLDLVTFTKGLALGSHRCFANRNNTV